jgi:hypothetical protein
MTRSTSPARHLVLAAEADPDHRQIAYRAPLESDLDAVAAGPGAERSGDVLMLPSGEMLQAAIATTAVLSVSPSATLTTRPVKSASAALGAMVRTTRSRTARMAPPLGSFQAAYLNGVPV